MECTKCGSELDALGKLPIRVGGVSGTWHLLFHELADMEENLVALDVYRCPRCKRVEFYDLDENLPVQ